MTPERKLQFKWIGWWIEDHGHQIASLVILTLAIWGVWILSAHVARTKPAAAIQHHDDSDPPGGGFSGMDVFTDNLTGVQYLSYGVGLTPRLNTDGTLHRVEPKR